MGRRPLVAAVLIAVTVLLALSWFGWGREGLRPVTPAGDGADGINDLYAFIGVFAVLIFLSVMIPLALIIARYRERDLPREVEGPQIRGNTRLELLWTAVPILIVVVLSGFTLYKAPQITDPDDGAEAPALEVDVEGRLFYWRYVYPNGAISIDRLRLPVGRVTEVAVTAPEHDVQHSFWVPALQGKMDAIPGVVNRLKLRPTRLGVFDGRCAELCGIQHAAMELSVEVMPQREFDRWLAGAATQAPRELGAELWSGVCAKCHFAAPEYAPNIVGNPLLGDARQVRQIVQQGRGRMPAVGRGWSARELRALTEYVETLAPREDDDGG